MTTLLLATSTLVAGGLLFLEWRRANRRHLLPRLLATGCAVVAVAGLLASHSDGGRHATLREAVLWTVGGSPATNDKLPPTQFVLPDAAKLAPPGTTIIPDVGTLRRRFPALETLHILGDGLDPAELPKVAGLRVVFHAARPKFDQPAISFLHTPRELSLGEPMEVNGRMEGLPPGTSLPLTLEAPDGQKIEAITASANADGGADFTLRSPALPVAGRYVWRLRGGQIDEPLGVSVVASLLPRILMLEGSPHFDTAALRRWYEEVGGSLTARTQVGKDHQRFAFSLKEVPSFTAIDTPLLAGFDLLLVDGQALTNLAPEETTALAAAIEKTGLGLLVLVDDALPPAQEKPLPPLLANLFPWKFSPAEDAAPNEERLIRPRWLGQASAPDVLVPAAPLFVPPTPAQTSLIDDRRDHVVAASARRGLGKVAVSLVRDTSRWQRGNAPAAFAGYWSFLFSRLARPDDGKEGKWRIVNDGGGPLFVDHPVELAWSGPADQGTHQATVMSRYEGATAIPLPLAQSASEASRWLGTFWPEHPGWHQVETKGGATLSFYVHPAGSWPALQAARRRSATERFATDSNTAVLSSALPPFHRSITPAWWYALFLLAAGYLWIERRFQSGTA